MKDLTKNRWKFVLIPALIVIAGIVLYIVHGGFNFDVEFMGGIRMQVNMHTDFDNKEVADLIQEKTVDTVSAKVQTGDNPQVAVIKTPPVDETVKTEIFNALKDKYNLSDDDLLSVLHIACYNLYLDLHCNSFRVEKCYYGCYRSCNQRTYHGCDLCYNKHSA